MSEQDHRASEAGGGSLVLTALWRAKIAIAVVAVLFGVAAYEVSLLSTKTYEAEAGVVLSETSNFNALGEGQGGGDPGRYLANQIALMTSTPVLDVAASTAGVGATSAELSEVVTAAPSTDGDELTIVASAPTSAQAAARANAVVAAYQAARTTEVTTARDNAIAAVQQGAADSAAAAVDPDVAAEARAEGPAQVAQITNRAQSYGDGVAVVNSAVEPDAPTEPQPLRNALIAAVLGALIAAGVAVWLRGKRRDDAEALVRSSGVPVLGVVPVGRTRDRQVHEALAPLVSLQYLAVGRPAGPVLVTALQGQDATADVVVGLAAAAAKEGQRVLLLTVGSDEVGLVKGSGLPVAPPPLTSAAADGELPHTALAPVPALSHLPGGHDARLASIGGGLLRSDDLARVLERLGAAFDLVVVAAGPLARDARAYALVRGCATVVAVVHGDRSFASVSTSWDDLQDRLSVAARGLDGVIITQRALRGRRADSGQAAKSPLAQSPSGPSSPVSAAAARPAPVAPQGTPDDRSATGSADPQGRVTSGVVAASPKADVGSRSE